MSYNNGFIIRATLEPLIDRAHWHIARYRAGFHSLIKRAIEEFDSVLYKIYFAGSKPRVKPYTFSVLFPKAQFKNDSVFFDKCVFMFSSMDPEFIAALTNFFTVSEDIKILNVSLRPKKTEFYKLPRVTDSEILVQTLSPVLVRSKDNPNHYLVPKCYDAKGREFGDEGFEESLRENVKQEVQGLAPYLENFVQSLRLEPIDCKFTLIKYKKDGVLLKFPGFRGIFRLAGEPELLNFLLTIGLGSRRSQGFGMLELIKRKEGA